MHLRLRETDLQWRAVEGEVVALDVQGSQYLGVNGSGAALWDMLAAGTTRAALVDQLQTRHALEASTAAQHVDTFLDQLRELKILDERE